MTDKSKAIRIIAFSGKQEDWNCWSKQFLATETARGHREVLKPKDPKVRQDSNDNNKVYAHLMMACEDDVMFGIIEEAMLDEFPEGDARLAWSNLYKKFEPNTGGRKVRLKSEFQKTRLVDVRENPDNWIRQLELIKRQLNVLGDKLDKEDLMLHILNNMPSKYKNVVQTSEEDLTDGELTMSKLTKRIRNRYC